MFIIFYCYFILSNTLALPWNKYSAFASSSSFSNFGFQYFSEKLYISFKINSSSGINLSLDLNVVKQDIHLAKNQEERIRCGDNGIFKGVPLTNEQKKLSNIARNIYSKFKSDGKYILDNNRLIICQSNASFKDLKKLYKNAEINPLGDWTGGLDVDTGATNRKLGSDMADSITGGGIHGKDLSKADVSINIYAFYKAQKLNKEINLSCAIGDEIIDGKPYEEIVKEAKAYIDKIGGFEKLAEWGLY